jgi:hypothetical protein
MSELGSLTARCVHGVPLPVERSGEQANDLGRRWKFVDGCCTGLHPDLPPTREKENFPLGRFFEKAAERWAELGVTPVMRCDSVPAAA